MKKFLTSVIILLFMVSGAYAKEVKGSTKIELTATKISGNTESKTFYGNLTRKKKYKDSSSYKFEYRAYYIEDEAENYKSSLRYKSYIINDGIPLVYIFGEGFYKKDVYSGFKHQYAMGPGLGFTLLNDETHVLDVMGSIFYQSDRERESGNHNSDATGNANIEYEWNIIKDKLTFTEEIDYTRFYKTDKLYTFDTKSMIEYKLTKIFSLGLTYITEYRNIVPEGVDSYDKTLMSTIIANF